jgi:dolichol-phosphate mannosyltransferase
LSTPPDLSIVCVAGDYAGNLRQVHQAFARVFSGYPGSLEFIYVLAGKNTEQAAGLESESVGGPPLRIFRIARGFGAASALQFAFGKARGRRILCIPDRFQVEPEDARKVLERLDAGADVVVTRREPRGDAWLNRIQSKIFHAMVRRIAKQGFRDLTCEMRGFDTEVAKRLELYGDLHRFIPVLAARRGYRVEEVPVRQREEDRRLRVFLPGVYARRLLDVLQVSLHHPLHHQATALLRSGGDGAGRGGRVVTGVLGSSACWGGPR